MQPAKLMQLSNGDVDGNCDKMTDSTITDEINAIKPTNLVRTTSTTDEMQQQHRQIIQPYFIWPR